MKDVLLSENIELLNQWAKVAFERYIEYMADTVYFTSLNPNWDELSPEIKQAWCEALKSVWDGMNNRIEVE
jgi:hypothetical protein